jgi:prophage regulatory protein
MGGPSQQPTPCRVVGGPEEHRHGTLPSPAFFRIRDVLRITSLSRPTLYRRIAEKKFPRPVSLGGRACGWPSAALQMWLDDPAGYRAPLTSGAETCGEQDRPRKYG